SAIHSPCTVQSAGAGGTDEPWGPTRTGGYSALSACRYPPPPRGSRGGAAGGPGWGHRWRVSPHPHTAYSGLTPGGLGHECAHPLWTVALRRSGTLHAACRL